MGKLYKGKGATLEIMTDDGWKYVGVVNEPPVKSITINELMNYKVELKGQITQTDNQIVRGIFKAFGAEYKSAFDEVTLDELMVILPEGFLNSGIFHALNSIKRLTVVCSKLTDDVVIAKKPDINIKSNINWFGY